MPCRCTCPQNALTRCGITAVGSLTLAMIASTVHLHDLVSAPSLTSGTALYRTTSGM